MNKPDNYTTAEIHRHLSCHPPPEDLMTSQPSRSKRPRRRSPVRSHSTAPRQFSAEYLKRLKDGNAAILHFRAIIKERTSAAK